MSNIRTSVEQEAFCKAWKQSNTTQSIFCKQNNISVSALYRWLKSFNKNSNIMNIKPDPIKFLQINDVGPNKNLYHENNVEIALPNGISIKTNLSQNSFNIFLQELLKWK